MAPELKINNSPAITVRPVARKIFTVVMLPLSGGLSRVGRRNALRSLSFGPFQEIADVGKSFDDVRPQSRSQWSLVRDDMLLRCYAGRRADSPQIRLGPRGCERSGKCTRAGVRFVAGRDSGIQTWLAHGSIWKAARFMWRPAPARRRPQQLRPRAPPTHAESGSLRVAAPRIRRRHPHRGRRPGGRHHAIGGRPGSCTPWRSGEMTRRCLAAKSQASAT